MTLVQRQRRHLSITRHECRKRRRRRRGEGLSMIASPPSFSFLLCLVLVGALYGAEARHRRHNSRNFSSNQSVLVLGSSSTSREEPESVNGTVVLVNETGLILGNQTYVLRNETDLLYDADLDQRNETIQSNLTSGLVGGVDPSWNETLGTNVTSVLNNQTLVTSNATQDLLSTNETDISSNTTNNETNSTGVEPSGSTTQMPSGNLTEMPIVNSSDIPTLAPSYEPLNTSAILTKTPTPTNFSNITTEEPSFYPTSTSAPSNVTSFRTVNCTHDPDIQGYESAASLLEDLMEYEMEQTIILCPNITFENLVIVVDGSLQSVPIVVECGGTHCVSTNVTSHLVLKGTSVPPVVMRGITFVGASETSVRVNAGSANLAFENCEWFNNSGANVIHVSGHSPASASSRYLRHRWPEVGNSTLTRNVNISIKQCEFANNLAETGILESQLGQLDVENCSFSENYVVNGSVVVVEDGIFGLVDTSFERNEYLGGLVFVGEKVLVPSRNESLCQAPKLGFNTTNASFVANATARLRANLSRTSDMGCDGVWMQLFKECFDFNLCPMLPPSTNETTSEVPTFAPNDCYSTLEQIANEIGHASAPSTSISIRICAGTVLNADTEYLYTPIEVTHGDFHFECGEGGMLSEGCMIYGGDVQIRIGPDVERVLFSGISFVGAKTLSVLAAGSSASEANFQNCQWRSHSAVTGVLVYSEAMGEPYYGQRNIEQLQPPSDASMSVNFDSCFFEENSFSYAAVANVGGDVYLNRVVFKDNQRSRVGVVGVAHEGSVGISFCCFIDNKSLLDGVILVDKSSNVTRNSGNFGNDNDSLLGGCDALFQDSGNCTLNGDCRGTCQPFEGDTCGTIIDVMRDIGETPPPMAAPTVSPEVPPNSYFNNATLGQNADNGGTSNNAISIVIVVIFMFAVIFVAWKCWKGKKDSKVGKAVPKNDRKKAPKQAEGLMRTLEEDALDDVYDDYDDSYDNGGTKEKKDKPSATVTWPFGKTKSIWGKTTNLGREVV